MRALVLTATAVVLAGCGPKIVLVDRPGCDACHRPLREDGVAVGIEKAHPPVDGRAFECVDCHGGDPDARKQSDAHVSPGAGGTRYIRNLTIDELDRVDPDYLRFVNPGDLRVAPLSCGGGARPGDGNGCHQVLIDTVRTNQMATFSGELGVARYRAGEQRSGAGIYAVYDVRDPDFVVGEVPGTVGALSKMQEPRIAEGETNIGPYQDLYLTKACMRCHLYSFGDNKFPGDFRSSGCSACHMLYADDGLSGSRDPTVSKGAPGHALRHELTRKIPTEQCMHCHYRGGRIGPSFNGYREGAGPGFDPPNPGFLGQAIHGHDASFYITDEDVTNDRDETPPDVHRTAGMDCIDCHTSHDVHGDGKLYIDTYSAIEIRCSSCHGTIDNPSTLTTALGASLDHLVRDADDRVWLTTKIKGLRLEVPQIAHAIAAADPTSYLFRSMGRDATGFSHTDSLECETCHSGWLPTCYGCHVSVDMTGVQRSLISGISTPGEITGTRKWVATDDLILMMNTRGKIAPSMPTEKMFFTAIDGSGAKVIDNQVRVGPNGEPGMGQRTFQPHTVQRWSPFMRCDRCHPIAGTFENMERVNVVIGLGSNRYPETDGNGTTWQLDRILDATYTSEVLVGHDEPQISRPLPAAVINRMLAVEVSAPSCSVPPGVAVPFDVLQDEIFTPTCATSRCHEGALAPYGMLLTAGESRRALVDVPSVGKPGETLVVPGSPETSYLIEKLIVVGDIDGVRMPQDRSPLLDCQVDMIRGWIQEGAK